MGSNASKPTTVSVDKREIVHEKAAAVVSDKVSLHQPTDDAVVLGESLTANVFDKWEEEFNKNPTLNLSRLVITHNDPVATLIDRSALVKDHKVFNLSLKGIGEAGSYPGPRVSQNSSGRCWLFATTNVLRYNVIEKLNLGDFELSQSYPYFYDKIEKANYYLENVIELKDEPLDSRVMSWINTAPVNDGGQWDMSVNLLEKYGMVPKTVFPESFSSSSSGKMCSLLTSKLREYAIHLRSAPEHEVRKLKAVFLHEIFNTLVVTLGKAPGPDEKFTWEYNDKDGKYKEWTGTPKEFYHAFGRRKNMDPSESFSLINDPRNQYEKLYTVERLGNVWGAKPIRYVNAPFSALEAAVVAGIKANTPLFFGCDVGKSSNTQEGVMDTKLYDLKSAYGYTLNMTKEQRLRMGETSMTHAMVITAVQVDKDGKPVKYKVENSWSDSAGEKGWFMMTADWFKEHVFQVVVPRSIMEDKWVKVLDQEPVVLPPWDPMGSLA